MPLADIKVCDLTQNLAGPYCSQILADLGATVVKVEPPGGDLARAWGPPFWGSESALSLSVNRGKRSIVLDLKTGSGKDVLRRLATESDVFVQASRPGVAERLGLKRRLEAVRNTRNISKADMKLNDYQPDISVDPQTYEVFADGELLSCEPAEVLPLAQRYLLL